MVSRFLPFSLSKQRLIPEPPSAPSPSEPAPIVVRRLNFTGLGLPEYKDRYALVIDNIFTPEDCQKLISAAEAFKDWEVAQINGGEYQYTDTSYRNSSRIMLDDHDLAGWILERIRPHLADIELIDETGYGGRGSRQKQRFRLLRLNERLRFLKYGPGQFFKRHMDGTYVTPDETEISYYTLQIYLDGSADTLKGGATRFWAARMNRKGNKETPYVDVESRTGRVLVFEQAGLMHSGEPVLQGSKISMRTDLMYVLEDD